MQPTEDKKFKILAENILIAGLIVLCFITSAITLSALVGEIQHMSQFLRTECKVDNIGLNICNLTCTHTIGHFTFQDTCPQQSNYRIIYADGKYQVAYERCSLIYFVCLGMVALSTSLISFVLIAMGIFACFEYISGWLVKNLASFLRKMFVAYGIKIE
jgi:hypothetical protein